MKTIKFTTAVLAITLIIASKSQAQFVITSYGEYNNWYLPTHVSHSIGINYHGYEIAHTRRIVSNHGIGFSVILNRGNSFVELTINRHGRVVSRVNYSNYPLHDHVCSGQCGFHTAYYNNHYYNHRRSYVHFKHGHYNNKHYGNHNKHHGNHNKVVYVNNNHESNYNTHNNHGNGKNNIQTRGTRSSGNQYDNRNNGNNGNHYGQSRSNVNKRSKSNNGNHYGQSRGNSNNGNHYGQSRSNKNNGSNYQQGGGARGQSKPNNKARTSARSSYTTRR